MIGRLGDAFDAGEYPAGLRHLKKCTALLDASQCYVHAKDFCRRVGCSRETIGSRDWPENSGLTSGGSIKQSPPWA